ncbi:MAG: SWIM zinc finger family protein [bacterium]
MTKPIWSSDQVNQLAPDAASIKAAKKLNKPAKWPLLGVSDDALWGECQGSGKKPYQTVIEFAEPAFKCTCPSRKFPCKHALALALIYAEQTSTISESEPPAWVSDWLDKRQKKQAKKVTKDNTPVDEATLKKRAVAQQKRQQKRADNVDRGVQDLQQWLEDMTRQGLAQIAEDQSAWRKMAQRMVDAQAGGLARWLERCSDIRYQYTAWQAPLLREMGRLYLLLQAWQRIDTLPDNVQAEVRSLIGFPVSQQVLQAQPIVTDVWQIVGQTVEDNEGMSTQRTWLYGQNHQQFALLLDFAMRGKVLPIYPPVGTWVKNDLAYYPTATPLRAIIMNQTHLSITPPIPPENLNQPVQDCTTGLQQFATHLAQSPWLQHYPLFIQGKLVQATASELDQQWHWCDSNDHCLPLHLNTDMVWKILALSGGYPSMLCALWDGAYLTPLSLWVENHCYSLSSPLTQEAA